ncbi:MULTISPECIES: dihydroxyacetone kinase phosphoryl donor subunit DhaM [unclassified Agrococcus]|uniref:dihydroxyacetone kinase phosphoryl donor subunit DhaM n=1 Tax=unclassified Agrococcus TaxID=2615065 RepID=UPI00360EC150
MSVGLVVVSHAARIAEGIVELAGQMAGDVAIVAAGGTDDGGIGTSFDRVMAALGEADSGDGVVVLCDLGSAVLTAETALDLLDDDARERVAIADAPIVEGAVAAAVAAQAGDSLADVLAAARSANGAAAPAEAAPEQPAVADGDAPSRTLRLVNASGLHARPAADLVQLAATFDARVLVDGVDARSMLRILALGLDRGDTVTVSATGSQAQEAVDAVAALVERGFDEA